MTTGPSRLSAIADLIGSAEGLHGEHCGIGAFEECCGQSTYDALRTLGVLDYEISAARRKRDRDIAEYYRQQREEVAHGAILSQPRSPTVRRVEFDAYGEVAHDYYA